MYDGAATTVLEAVMEHMLWFSEHSGMSKEALSNMLQLQHQQILPHGNKLPKNYEAAWKLVAPFLAQPVLFDVCPKDCIIFRGKYMHLDRCPQCHSEHFVTGKVPARRFTYLLIGPRLERTFGTARLSEVVQSHCSRSDNNV